MNSWASLILLSQVLATSLFSEVQSQSYDCNPDNFCLYNYPGSKTPDPYDCNSYYLCITTENSTVPSDKPVACPDGQYFNAQQGDCDVETTTCASPCLNRRCPTECHGNLGMKVAYPGNCNKYYACVSNDEKVDGQCSDEEPYFDGTECSTDPKLCCDLCQPYCEMPNTEVRDPFDCRAYYLCFEYITIPTASQRYECNVNMHFDSDLGKCVKDNVSEPECESLCSNSTTQALFIV